MGWLTSCDVLTEQRQTSIISGHTSEPALPFAVGWGRSVGPGCGAEDTGTTNRGTTDDGDVNTSIKFTIESQERLLGLQICRSKCPVFEKTAAFLSWFLSDSRFRKAPRAFVVGVTG